MQTRKLDEFVKIGTSLRYLIDINPGTALHGSGFVLSNIESLLQGLLRLGFLVSTRGAHDIFSIRDRLQQLPQDAVLSYADREALYAAVNDVYPIVRAEAAGMIAFVTTDKRIDVAKLIEKVNLLLAPGVYDALPSLVRYDLSEAGKCIAFERATAAAFHLLRATEGALRWLIAAMAPEATAEPMNWGPVIEALRKHPAAPPPELLNHLDNIRRSFRNPTQHPDKVYDIYEAQDLLGLCFDAINRMVKHAQT